MHKYTSPEGICAHVGDHDMQFLGAVVPPIFMNSLHVFESVEDMRSPNPTQPRYVYGRVSNPTVALAEQKIAALEHTEACIAFASGMAALTSAVLSAVKAGSHVITVRNVYGVSRNFLTNYLNRFDVSVTYVKDDDTQGIVDAIQPNTTLIYIENPVSISFKLLDIRAITAVAKARGITTMIDNTWCTPIFQQPYDMGVDLVCHTISKYLGGHSDLIGGVICGAKERIDKIAQDERAMLGGILGPMEGAFLVRSLRTLPIRMKHFNEAGLKVAAWTENHPRVKRVMHPGLPSHPQYELGKTQMSGYAGVFGAELDLTPKQVDAFVNALEIFQIGVSWGGHESLCLGINTGATDEHIEYSGVPRTWVRIVCGLETPEELIEDIEQAIEKAIR